MDDLQQTVLSVLSLKASLVFHIAALLSSYNLFQTSWNACIISSAHLVVSSSPPQNNVVIYSVDRYRKVAMLADPSLTNEHFIQHCF